MATNLASTTIGGGGFVSNPPVNVMVSFDTEAAVDDFLHYTDLEKQKRTFVFKTNNTGFLNFSHGIRNNNVSIRLSLVDPGAAFISEFMDEAVLRTKTAQTYYKGDLNQRFTQMKVMYGIGDNPQFWAGPFVCVPRKVSYGFEDTGLETVDLELVPDVSMTIGSFLTSMGSASKSEYKNRMNNFKVLLGTLKLKQQLPSSRPSYFFEDLDATRVAENIANEIAEIYKSLGATNVICFLPTAFTDKINLLINNQQYNSTTLDSGYTYALANDAVGVNPLRVLVRQMGLDISYVEGESKNIDVFLIPGEAHRENFNPEKFLGALYSGVNTISERNESFKYYAETNGSIIKLMEDSIVYGSLIEDSEKAVHICGPTRIIDKYVYGYKKSNTQGYVYQRGNTKVDGAYLSQVRDYLNTKYSQNYYTHTLTKGEVDTSVDEGQLTQEDTKQYTEFLPRFSANDSKANILSFDADVDMLSYATLLASVRALDNPEETREFLRKEFERMNDTAGNVEFAKEKSNVEMDIDFLTDQAMEQIFANEEDKVSTVSSSSDKEALRAFALFFWKMSVQGFIQMEIETIPHFHLSEYNIIGKLCEVHIYKNPDPNQRFRDDDFYNTFYSGQYYILGFEHSMDSGGSSSSFRLIKKSGPRVSTGKFGQLIQGGGD